MLFGFVRIKVFQVFEFKRSIANQERYQNQVNYYADVLAKNHTNYHFDSAGSSIINLKTSMKFL